MTASFLPSPCARLGPDQLWPLAGELGGHTVWENTAPRPRGTCREAPGWPAGSRGGWVAEGTGRVWRLASSKGQGKPWQRMAHRMCGFRPRKKATDTLGPGSSGAMLLWGPVSARGQV